MYFWHGHLAKLNTNMKHYAYRMMTIQDHTTWCISTAQDTSDYNSPTAVVSNTHNTHRRIISTNNAMYNNKKYETLELLRTMHTKSDNGDTHLKYCMDGTLMATRKYVMYWWGVNLSVIRYSSNDRRIAEIICTHVDMIRCLKSQSKADY